MPRRKYGRLTKKVDKPPKDNCSRCRSGKYCPLEGHAGQKVKADRSWQGIDKLEKRKSKKNPSRR
ncbi:MAG: hypothetical protein CMA82_03115 [Euryarchaeota archaeon]|nr:hypothetical protein [Euryarchaeota archaeon]